jgi:multidrug efflux system membrane fusion protein
MPSSKFIAKHKQALPTAGLLLAVVAGLLVLGACSSGKQQVQASAPSAVPVVVSTVEEKNLPIEVHAIGAVEAYSTVNVKSNVAGELTGVYFKEGDFVRKGQLLFTIDKRPFQAALDQAKGNLAKDIAQAANAKAQAARYQALEKEGVVAKEQADQMTTSAAALEAAVEADRAAVETAKVQLTYCTIYSPINGRTGNLAVQAGNLVKANDTPYLITITQVEPIYVTFTVPEQYLAQIKQYSRQRKLPVTAAFPNPTGGPAVGALSFIDNLVDQSTGTIKLKGTFANRDNRLWPGQFVNVSLTLTTKPNAVVVPSQAVQTGQNGTFVFIVKPDMTAEARPVVISQNINGEAMVEQGLKPGERVVTDGQLRLMPGAKVELKSAVMNPAGTPGSEPAASPAQLPNSPSQRLSHRSAARAGD